MTTGFFWDERCFWHMGGNYVLTMPVGGLVQPLSSGGFPDSPESKRRLKSIIDATGLSHALEIREAPPASRDDLARVHPASYLGAFKKLSDDRGGEIGPRAPFGAGGYDIAAQSAGLAKAALEAVLTGDLTNAYALSRPPGHHCLPDKPNGFCLLANIPIAIEAARAAGLATRLAVIDWDVHHGNGTEAIYYEDPDTLTISLHQDRNYPVDTGGADDRGSGAGLGANLNVPLPPGSGHAAFLAAMDRLVLPALERFEPEAIVIACGFDAAAFDPLSQMLATSDTFREMTKRVMTAAERLCGGRLVMVHEGGYSEAYVPFCGHAVLETMAGSALRAPDPWAETLVARQPDARFDGFVADWIEDLARRT